MILKINTPKGGLEYLLGSIDNKNRNRESEIICGDLNSVAENYNTAKSKYKNPFVCFTFREPKSLDDIGGVEFENQLLDDAMETIFPGFELSDLSYLAIRHHNNDKSYELNIFVVSMINQRQYTTYWKDRDHKAFDFLNRKIHNENHLLTDPNSPKFVSLFKEYSEWNVNKKNLFKQVKEDLSLIINLESPMKTPSKAQIEEYLVNNGYKVEYRDFNNKANLKQKGVFPYIIKNNTEILLKTPLFKSSMAPQPSKRNYNLDFKSLWQNSNAIRNKTISKKYKNLKAKEKYEQQETVHYKQSSGIRTDNISMERHNFKPNFKVERRSEIAKRESIEHMQERGSATQIINYSLQRKNDFIGKNERLFNSNRGYKYENNFLSHNFEGVQCNNTDTESKFGRGVFAANTDRRNDDRSIRTNEPDHFTEPKCYKNGKTSTQISMQAIEKPSYKKSYFKMILELIEMIYEAIKATKLAKEKEELEKEALDKRKILESLVLKNNLYNHNEKELKAKIAELIEAKICKKQDVDLSSIAGPIGVFNEYKIYRAKYFPEEVSKPKSAIRYAPER